MSEAMIYQRHVRILCPEASAVVMCAAINQALAENAVNASGAPQWGPAADEPTHRLFGVLLAEVQTPLVRAAVDAAPGAVMDTWRLVLSDPPGAQVTEWYNQGPTLVEQSGLVEYDPLAE